MLEFVRIFGCVHSIDVIMTTMASQISSLAVVYSSIYSDANQRKHQSSASLAFVWGIHRDRWIPCTKDQLRGKCFHLMTSSCDVSSYKFPTKFIESMSYITNILILLYSHIDGSSVGYKNTAMFYMHAIICWIYLWNKQNLDCKLYYEFLCCVFNFWFFIPISDLFDALIFI